MIFCHMNFDESFSIFFVDEVAERTRMHPKKFNRWSQLKMLNRVLSSGVCINFQDCQAAIDSVPIQLHAIIHQKYNQKTLFVRLERSCTSSPFHLAGREKIFAPHHILILIAVFSFTLRPSELSLIIHHRIQRRELK